MVSSKTLVKYLKENAIHAGLTDHLKMVFRPYICPFGSLISYMNEGEVVADIGCGSGQFALLLARFGRPHTIYGYEISKDLIENAERLCRDKTNTVCHFELYNGIDIPESISSADVVFMIDVLHHIPKKAVMDFFEKLHNRMKKGSRLVLKDINADSPFVFFNKLHDLIFSGETGHEIPVNKAIKIIQELDYKILHTEKKLMYVYPHYTIVAEK